MKTHELKAKLISSINSTENQHILEEISKILEIEQQDIEPIKLNELQKKLLSISLKQVKNGEYLTDEEANKDIDEWFNKHSSEKDNLD